MHHAHIDRFAHQDSPLHRLDARGKLLAVLAYTAVLISFSRYETLRLAPMFVGPLAMLWIGNIPLWLAFRRVLLLSPLVLMAALASVLSDHSTQVALLGPWRVEVAGGYLTAANVLVKFALALLAMTALVAGTPFALLLEAMRRLGLPRLMGMVLAFLYRYIFVLLDESMRLRRARDFRGAALAGPGRKLAAAGSVAGSLLVRTLDRSGRVYTAMQCRGYSGQSVSLERLALARRDAVFLVTVVAYLVLCRAVL